MKCEYCGGEIDEDYRCPRCGYRIEDRINFSGVHFEFARDEIKRRKYKELPFPTHENRCEKCWFAIPCISGGGGILPDLLSCKLAVIGFNHDISDPMYLPVRFTGTCTRFRERYPGKLPAAVETSIKFVVPGISDNLSIKIHGKLKYGTVNDVLDKISRYFHALGREEKFTAVNGLKNLRAAAGDAGEIDLAMPVAKLPFKVSRSYGMDFFLCTISFEPFPVS